MRPGSRVSHHDEPLDPRRGRAPCRSTKSSKSSCRLWNSRTFAFCVPRKTALRAREQLRRRDRRGVRVEVGVRVPDHDLHARRPSAARRRRSRPAGARGAPAAGGVRVCAAAASRSSPASSSASRRRVQRRQRLARARRASPTLRVQHEPGAGVDRVLRPSRARRPSAIAARPTPSASKPGDPRRRAARRRSRVRAASGSSVGVVGHRAGRRPARRPSARNVLERPARPRRPRSELHARLRPRRAPARRARASCAPSTRHTSVRSSGPSPRSVVDRLAHLERVADRAPERLVHVGQHAPITRLPSASPTRTSSSARCRASSLGLHERAGADLHVEHDRVGAARDLLA